MEYISIFVISYIKLFINNVYSCSWYCGFPDISNQLAEFDYEVISLTRIICLDGSNQTLTVNQQVTDVHIHIQQVKFKGRTQIYFSKIVSSSFYTISTNLLGVSLVNILVLQREARLINQYYSFIIQHDQIQTCQLLSFQVPKTTFVYQFFLLSFSYSENSLNALSNYQAKLLQNSSTQFSLCLIQSPNFQSFVINLIGLNTNTLLQGGEFMSNFVYSRSNFSLYQYSSTFHVPTAFRLAFTPVNILSSSNLINYEIELLNNFNAKEFYADIMISQFYIRVLYHAQIVCHNDEFYFIQNQTCYPVCPLATFAYFRFCIVCMPNCYTCNAKDSCLTCKQGFLNYVSFCEECPQNCKVCSVDRRCVSCKDGYYLDEFCKQKSKVLTQFKVTMNQNKQLLIRLLTNVAQPEALLSKIDIVCVGCRIHTINRKIAGPFLTVQALADQAQQRLQITNQALLRPQYQIQQRKFQFQARLPMMYLQTRAQCQQSLNNPDLLSCKIQLLNNKLLSAPAAIRIKIENQNRTAQISYGNSSLSFEFRVNLSQCRDCLVEFQLSSDFVLKEFMFTRAVKCRADFVALGDTSSKFVVQLNSATNKTFGFFNWLLALMNLFGLLQPVELIFLSISSIKLTTRFTKQTPIIYRPFPLSVSSIQNLLLPDMITNSLQTNLNQVLSQSTLWLIAYLLPIVTAAIFHLLIAKLMTHFALTKRLFRPNENIDIMQSLQAGNLFSMGAMSFVIEQSIQKMLIVNFACCWLFFSFLFLKQDKTISYRVKILSLYDFQLSFLLGIASRILSDLAELACLAILLHQVRLFIGYKFKQKIVHQICTGLLICVNICLFVSKFTKLQETVLLGVILIALFSAILIVNLISIILMTTRTLKIIYRRYKNMVIQQYQTSVKSKKMHKYCRAIPFKPITKIRQVFLREIDI